MAYELFKKYKESLEKDLDINRLNLDEKALALPAIKHFWVAKMVEAKIEINELELEKKKLFKILAESDQMQEAAYSKETIQKIFNNSEKVKEINEKIEELKLIVEYLTDVKYVLGRATDDIKNRIELEKAETL